MLKCSTCVIAVIIYRLSNDWNGFSLIERENIQPKWTIQSTEKRFITCSIAWEIAMTKIFISVSNVQVLSIDMLLQISIFCIWNVSIILIWWASNNVVFIFYLLDKLNKGSVQGRKPTRGGLFDSVVGKLFGKQNKKKKKSGTAKSGRLKLTTSKGNIYEFNEKCALSKDMHLPSISCFLQISYHPLSCLRNCAFLRIRMTFNYAISLQNSNLHRMHHEYTHIVS